MLIYCFLELLRCFKHTYAAYLSAGGIEMSSSAKALENKLYIYFSV